MIRQSAQLKGVCLVLTLYTTSSAKLALGNLTTIGLCLNGEGVFQLDKGQGERELSRENSHSLR